MRHWLLALHRRSQALAGLVLPRRACQAPKTEAHAAPTKVPFYDPSFWANTNFMTTDHPPASAAWFCVRTHSKREHVAARWLQRYLQIDAYVPRIRFRRPQPRGPVWFIEALFPNYLFARFDPDKSLQHVDYAPGIRGVVRFGAHRPTIPEDVIENLRATVGANHVYVVDQRLQEGETVQVASGLFQGLEAVVARAMPAQERVTVLLEFLGRQTMVELSALAVARVGDERQRVFR